MTHLPIVQGFQDVPFFETTDEAMRMLKKHRVISAASDHGAMTVWMYDDTWPGLKPLYRAYRSVYCSMQDEIETRHLTELRSFIAKNLKKL